MDSSPIIFSVDLPLSLPLFILSFLSLLSQTLLLHCFSSCLLSLFLSYFSSSFVLSLSLFIPLFCPSFIFSIWSLSLSLSDNLSLFPFCYYHTACLTTLGGVWGHVEFHLYLRAMENHSSDTVLRKPLNQHSLSGIRNQWSASRVANCLTGNFRRLLRHVFSGHTWISSVTVNSAGAAGWGEWERERGGGQEGVWGRDALTRNIPLFCFLTGWRDVGNSAQLETLEFKARQGKLVCSPLWNHVPARLWMLQSGRNAWAVKARDLG